MNHRNVYLLIKEILQQQQHLDLKILYTIPFLNF